MFLPRKRPGPFPRRPLLVEGGSLDQVLSAAARSSLLMSSEQEDVDDDDSRFTLLSEQSSVEDDDDSSGSGSDDDGDARTARQEEEEEEEEEKEEEVPPHLKKKWARLRTNYSARDKLLERISRGKSRTFVDLLKQHELEARAGAEERLLLSLLYEQRAQLEYDNSKDDNIVIAAAKMTPPPEDNVKKASTENNEGDSSRRVEEEPTGLPNKSKKKRQQPLNLKAVGRFRRIFAKEKKKEEVKNDEERDTEVSVLSIPDNGSPEDRKKPESAEDKEVPANPTTKNDDNTPLDQDIAKALSKCRAELNPLGLWRDILVFELHTTLPATLSMILYCLAHHGMYMTLSYVINSTIKGIYTVESMWSQDALYLGIFVFGFWSIRSTGYLYWFLSASDYDCVKFDFRNRLRLGKWDARCLHWLIRRDVTRAALFTLGYYLCYAAVEYFHGRLVDAWLDQKETIYANLPSRQYDLHVSLDDSKLQPEVEGSPHSFSCQQRMDEVEKRYEELREADVWYTYGVLSTDSYENFWYGYNEGLNSADTGSLLSATSEALVCVGTVVLSIAALTAYGFTFWAKY